MGFGEHQGNPEEHLKMINYKYIPGKFSDLPIVDIYCFVFIL